MIKDYYNLRSVIIILDLLKNNNLLIFNVNKQRSAKTLLAIEVQYGTGPGDILVTFTVALNA